MNVNEAQEIFLQTLPELSEPLKSAVEFALSNWHKLSREPSKIDTYRMKSGAMLSATRGFIKSSTTDE